MRHVTSSTAFSLDRQMFVYKRALGFGMTLETDCLLCRGCAELMWSSCAVDVVTVAALDQPLIDTVPIRPAEFSLLFRVTSIAEGWLRIDEEAALVFRIVRRMTADTADVVGSVSRSEKIRMLP